MKIQVLLRRNVLTLHRRGHACCACAVVTLPRTVRTRASNLKVGPRCGQLAMLKDTGAIQARGALDVGYARSKTQAIDKWQRVDGFLRSSELTLLHSVSIPLLPASG